MPQTAFGVLLPNLRSPYIVPSSIKAQAQDVRREVGGWFNEKDHKAGWIEAKKQGYRVIKIGLQPS